MQMPRFFCTYSSYFFWIFPCSFLVGKIMYLQKGQVFTDIGFQVFRFLQIQENGPTFESDSVLSTSFSKRADRKTRKCVIATQLPWKVFFTTWTTNSCAMNGIADLNPCFMPNSKRFFILHILQYLCAFKIYFNKLNHYSSETY